MRILIVDDSLVFRSSIKAALEGVAFIEVAGVAANGKIAVEKIQNGSIDLITLDLEMPEMNGLETVTALRKLGIKVRVIIFASKTTSGAEMALTALRAGADDFVVKPDGSELSPASAIDAIRAQLLPKIKQFHEMKEGAWPQPLEHKAATQPLTHEKLSLANFKPQVIVIGCSTGGPDALERVFTNLRPNLRCPILIVQHMPPVFTKSLARRLSKLTGIEADEGSNWEYIKPNKIYIAPGDYHMSLITNEGKTLIHLDQGPFRNSVRPAVDSLFESAAKIYKSNCMGFVLTGMGEDGLEGAKSIKGAGGRMMIQDEKTSVVWGMPGAVFKSDAYDKIGTLEDIQSTIIQMATA